MAQAGHPVALSTAKRKDLFGTFRYEVVPGKTRAIRLLDGWDTENVTSVTVPQLKGVDTYDGQSFSGKVRIHRLCVEQLKRAWEEVAAAGLLDLVLSWDGSFNPRRITTAANSPLSPHAWGIAFDINARWNAYGDRPRPEGEYGSVYALVPIFEAWGFAWGGWFTKNPDGMHFEVCRPGVTEPLRPRLVINGEPVLGACLQMRAGTNHGILGPIAAAIGDKANLNSTVHMPVAEYLRSHGYKVTWKPAEGPKGTVSAERTA